MNYKNHFRKNRFSAHGFALIFVVLIIAIAVVAAGGALYLKKIQTKKAEVTLSAATSTEESVSASSSETAQRPASFVQCKEDERLIWVPTSTEFTATENKQICLKAIVGTVMVSPDGKWSAALESDAKGPIWYEFVQGPIIFDGEANVFVLVANLSNGEKREVSIVSLAPQKIVAGLKEKKAKGQFTMFSRLVGWSSDGSKLRGEIKFRSSADPALFFGQASFEIDAPKLFSSVGASDAIGTLSGRVAIGPICPVETYPPKPECQPSAETYASREFVVETADGKTVTSFHADSSGSYRVSLVPGIYTVKSVKSGIGYNSKDLPAKVTIKAGETTTFNIDVDTGIR